MRTKCGGTHEAATISTSIGAMKPPIIVHTEEDYQRAQERAEELSASPESPARDAELAALAEAMLAYEMRRDEAAE